MPMDGKEAENLAYWYFRLNGYFTIKDFVVHPDLGIGQQTDIDVFGVRFPYRSELLKKSMEDDQNIIDDQKIHVAIVEVKVGQCSLNPSWKDPQRLNIERFLQAVGVLKFDEIVNAAKVIYERGMYENEHVNIEIIMVGERFNDELYEKYPDATQLVWGDILAFIYYRFKKFDLQKRLHSQWDDFGINLWRNYEQSQNEDEFIKKYLV